MPPSLAPRRLHDRRCPGQTVETGLAVQVHPDDAQLPFPIALPPEDSTRFCRKVSGGALTNRFTMSGKQILEAVEEAAGLLELSR